MKTSKRFLVGLLLILGLGACTHSTDSSSVAADSTEETQPGQRLAKFAPNDSTVLVFIGQDNEALRAKWVDKMSTPLYLHSTEGTYEKIGF